MSEKEALQAALVQLDNLKRRIQAKIDEIIEAERPKVGDVCKFWKNDEDYYSVCVLVKDDKSNIPYKTKQGSWYKNAKKITKEEAIELLFGKDGKNG